MYIYHIIYILFIGYIICINIYQTKWLFFFFALCLFQFLYSLRNLIFISQLKGQINYELEYEYNEGKCTVCAVFFFLCVYICKNVLPHKPLKSNRKTKTTKMYSKWHAHSTIEIGVRYFFHVSHTHAIPSQLFMQYCSLLCLHPFSNMFWEEMS